MQAKSRLPLLAALALALGFALAPNPAEARVGVFVGGFFGFPGYYYPPAYYYPPYPYYPTYYYYPPVYTYAAPPPPPNAPAPPAYSNAPPPPAPATAAKPAPGAPAGGNCHDFQTTEPGGSQPATHTACQQPDGTWKIVR